MTPAIIKSRAIPICLLWQVPDGLRKKRSDEAGERKRNY